MHTTPETFEGLWEDMARHTDKLTGHRVRVTILSEEDEKAKREATIAYFREKVKNPIADPEELAQAEAELAELQRNLNQNRIEAGETPLFPEDEP